MKNTTNLGRIPLKNRLLARALETLLGMNPLYEMYELWLAKRASMPAGKDTRQVPASAGDGLAQKPELAKLATKEEPGQASVVEQFLDHTLDFLQAKLKVIHEDRLGEIPLKGPVIFVANHPFGGIEGTQLARLLLRHRPDLKVLTNEMLTWVPEFSELFIGVDVLSPNSRSRNAAGMRKACRHLQEGGALMMFPAGTVASFDLLKGAIVERPWTSMAGRLARRYRASCMALHVEGRNSALFHLLGLVHKRLRTLMLAREFTNKRGTETRVVLGSLVKPAEIATFGDDDSLTDYLRLNSEALQLKNRSNAKYYEQMQGLDERLKPKGELQEHVRTLGDCLLAAKTGFEAYCAPYHRMGPLMTELAVIREQTCRAAGEGTGQEQDSDIYDPHYLHLFVWDADRHKLVGAYRMGQCDKILAERGVKGLYSRSLFRYDREYIERLGGALEMGRSFVSIEYQRNPRALDMLWRGIGAFVSQNPQYYTLFGCVSISSAHSVLAKAFLSDAMLTSFAAKPEFLTDIHPVSPLKVKDRLWTPELLESISDIAIINKLVGNFDHGKTIPVLLRHYLALNGRFVSFSVNHGFNQALDGLIIVDIRNSPMKYLNRYMGVEGAQRFLAQWKRNEAAA